MVGLLWLQAACTPPPGEIDLGIATPTFDAPAATATAAVVDLTDALAASDDPVLAFDTFLESAEAARFSDRPSLSNTFLTGVESTPLSSGTRVVFLWRGDANEVALAGDMNNWMPGEADQFTRLIGSNLWWLSAEYEQVARFDYQLIVDGERQLDPLNPRTQMTRSGFASELRMPDYLVPPEFLPTNDPIPAGTVSDRTLDSQFLGQTRTYFVYEPPGQLIGAPLPTLYVHDGADYLNIADMPALLDRLIADRDIPPLLVVFVPPIDRNREYARSDAHARFMAEELLPAVRAEFNVSTDPAQTGVLGSALGGLAAFDLALRYPELFGLVATQSADFTAARSAIVDEVGLAELPPLKVHMIIGRYETDVKSDSAEGDLLSANQRLAAFLAEKGIEISYGEGFEGHSWGFWRAQIGDALRFLYD